MAHKVMPPPFTSEQLEMLQDMINNAVQQAIDDLDWYADIEDAVQSAALDARSDVRGCESSIEDLERRVSYLED